MRPRIRTLKPDLWEDERVNKMSRDARLLFIGLITLADDEGRFRARRSTLIGKFFADDDDAWEAFDRWADELRQSGVVVFYTVDRVPYGAIRRWRKHQRINRPTPSELPPPPDPKVVRDNRVPKPGATHEHVVSPHTQFSEDAVSNHAPSAGATPIPSNPVLVVFEYWKDLCHKPRAKLTAERRTKVQARIEQGYSVEDIKAGVDGAARNPPRSDDGVVYDDLVSVCRNGAQLERYMERATAVPKAKPLSNVASMHRKLNQAEAMRSAAAVEEAH